MSLLKSLFLKVIKPRPCKGNGGNLEDDIHQESSGINTGSVEEVMNANIPDDAPEEVAKVSAEILRQIPDAQVEEKEVAEIPRDIRKSYVWELGSAETLQDISSDIWGSGDELTKIPFEIPNYTWEEVEYELAEVPRYIRNDAREVEEELEDQIFCCSVCPLVKGLRKRFRNIAQNIFRSFRRRRSAPVT